MTTITTEKIEELRRVTLAATPGEWEHQRIDEDSKEWTACEIIGCGDFVSTMVCKEQDAAFIAAANPATILALLDLAQRAMVPQPQGQALPESMPPTDDRQPYDGDDPDGYLESDKDWIDRNIKAVRWFINNHAAIRAGISASQLALPAGPVPALTRQQVFDKFSFLEGVVNEFYYRQIAETAIAMLTEQSPVVAQAIVAFREVAANGTPITDWIDGSLPANTPPLHPGATIQFAYGHPSPAVAQPVANERIDEIMSQAQVFASAWSMVGTRFDDGGLAETAEAEKTELRRMIRAALCPPAEEGGKS